MCVGVFQTLDALSGVLNSDWQGYGKPLGLEGKDSKGRGQGRHLATLEKPLPLTRVSRVWTTYTNTLNKAFLIHERPPKQGQQGENPCHLFHSAWNLHFEV